MTIVFPSNTREVIDDIRSAIGRVITFYVTASGIPCSVCEFDPITNTSLDALCSGCGGEYWIGAISGWPVLAHVTWIDAGRPMFTTGGYVLAGGCNVTIAYSGAALENVQNAEYVIVDGRDLIVSDFTLKGVPELNRITITLVEREG